MKEVSVRKWLATGYLTPHQNALAMIRRKRYHSDTWSLARLQSSPLPPRMPPKQALISSFLVKFTPDEKAERTAETFTRIGEDSAKRKVKAKFALQTKVEKERLQARARQQRRRAQLKGAEIASGIRDARTGQLIKEVRSSEPVDEPQTHSPC